MKQVILTLLIASGIQRLPAQVMPADRVNPFIGTNGMGHTFPGACAPRGIVQLSPDTGTTPHNIDGVYQPRAYDYCAGYRHEDSTIVGFSHTHFRGTGHSDLGDILVMPFTGARRATIRRPAAATALASRASRSRRDLATTRFSWRITA